MGIELATVLGRSRLLRIEGRGPIGILGFFLLPLAAFTLAALYCYAADVRDNSIFQLLGAANTLFFFVTLSVLLRRRDFFSAMIVFFLLLPPVQVFSVNYLADVALNWKNLFAYSSMVDALKLMNLYSFFIYTTLIFRAAIIEPVPPTSRSFALYAPTLLVLTLIALASAAITVVSFIGTTRNQWIRDASVEDRLVQILGGLGLSLTIICGILYRGLAVKVLAAIAFLAAIITAASGSRFVLVFCALGAASLIIIARPIKRWHIAALFSLGLMAYFLLLYFTFFRQNGISTLSILSGSSNLDVRFSDVLRYAGRQEQTALYTVSYALGLDRVYGMTYVDSVLRMFPYFIHSQLFDTLRPQDLLSGGAPIQFREAGLNLGAYFFAEAILNFGPIGPILILGAFLPALNWIERTKYRSEFSQMLYGVLSMMAPIFAMYGSSNFFKQTATAVLGIALISFLNRRRVTHKYAFLPQASR